MSGWVRERLKWLTRTVISGWRKYEPVEALLFHMERADVSQAVLIQYMGNSDNSYIVEAMAAHPGRFAAAMIVADDDDGSAIRAWAEQGLGGIRLLADFRGQGRDPLAHWRTAAELGLVVSVFSRPQILQSDEFGEVLRLFLSCRWSSSIWAASSRISTRRRFLRSPSWHAMKI